MTLVARRSRKGSRREQGRAGSNAAARLPQPPSLDDGLRVDSNHTHVCLLGACLLLRCFLLICIILLFVPIIDRLSQFSRCPLSIRRRNLGFTRRLHGPPPFSRPSPPQTAGSHSGHVNPRPEKWTTPCSFTPDVASSSPPCHLWPSSLRSISRPSDSATSTKHVPCQRPSQPLSIHRLLR